MHHEQALQIVEHVVSNASSPVSVFVADGHGEIVAAATMEGAAPDTRLNAQRKAYTAARSDAYSTAQLAEKVRDDPVERASFDPFFTFFLGGRDRRLRVHGVRAAVVEEADRRVGDDVAPVGRPALVAVARRGLGDRGLVAAGDRDQAGPKRRRPGDVPDVQERARMGLAHERVAQHPDPDLLLLACAARHAAILRMCGRRACGQQITLAVPVHYAIVAFPGDRD